MTFIPPCHVNVISFAERLANSPKVQAAQARHHAAAAARAAHSSNGPDVLDVSSRLFNTISRFVAEAQRLALTLSGTPDGRVWGTVLASLTDGEDPESVEWLWHEHATDVGVAWPLPAGVAERVLVLVRPLAAAEADPFAFPAGLRNGWGER